MKGSSPPKTAVMSEKYRMRRRKKARKRIADRCFSLRIKRGKKKRAEQARSRQRSHSKFDIPYPCRRVTFSVSGTSKGSVSFKG
jgi:hypothetical protein